MKQLSSFFLKVENINKTVIALLIGAATSIFASDLQVNLLNPIINNIIVYKENPRTSSQILWEQIVRSFIVLCVYLLFIGIGIIIFDFNKKHIINFVKKIN